MCEALGALLHKGAPSMAPGAAAARKRMAPESHKQEQLCCRRATERAWYNLGDKS